jgi:DNA gyrase subunit A
MSSDSQLASGGNYPYSTLNEDEIPEGLIFLVNGYTEYAKEVVIDRAIPNIDGFKPSQRRILYAMKYFEKVKELTKNNAITGAVSKLHPHGEASAYDTLVRMVHKSGYMGVPFLHGKGDFGAVYDLAPAAAARYTESMFTAIAEELFKDMAGINMIDTEDGHYKEPDLLPVPFPNVLCNTTQGIAVGMASNIPSFNYHDVLKATIELIETGDIMGVLIPDFTTGGYYVHDEDELRKIMNSGRGRVKLRGRYQVDGNTINISEVPYYTTANAIVTEARKIDGVSKANDDTDLYGFSVSVECRSKKIVEEVLPQLLKLTSLQMSMTTNITVIVNGTPRVIGIKQLLHEWVEFRKRVVTKTLTLELNNVISSIPQFELLVDLMSSDEKRETFVTTLAKSGKPKAADFLRATYKGHPGASEDTYNWIFGMTLTSLSGVGSKENKLAELRRRQVVLESDLQNIGGYIVRQLKELNSSYSFPRRTESTDIDYVFEKEDNVVVKADATPAVVVIDGKFVKKIRYNPSTENIQGLRCSSDDVISFIDTQGRLLRLNLENIDFVSERDRGTYLPVYLELEDDFDVICYELIQDKKVGYIFSDGFASVVDYSEWVDSKRTTRMTANGVSSLSGMIVGELDFTTSHIMFLTKTGKFGFIETQFKHKHRTARTKLIDVKDGDEITNVLPLNYTDMMQLVASPLKYVGKLSLLAHGDTFNSEYYETLI